MRRTHVPTEPLLLFPHIGLLCLIYPLIKSSKRALPTPFSLFTTYRKIIQLLALLRVDSGNCIFQSSDSIYIGDVTPAEILASLKPDCVIRRMSLGMVSTLCQENIFSTCYEDKSFTRGKPWHGLDAKNKGGGLAPNSEPEKKG